MDDGRWTVDGDDPVKPKSYSALLLCKTASVPGNPVHRPSSTLHLLSRRTLDVVELIFGRLFPNHARLGHDRTSHGLQFPS